MGFDGTELEADDELEACHRCDGKGWVPIALWGPDDPELYDRGQEWGERDCPHCGGSRLEPDPIQVAELRAQYGPSWDE